MFRSVVFLQGSEADEPLNIANDTGADDLFEYLLRWEYGEPGEVYPEEPWGTYDDTSVHYDGENKYIVAWNWNLQYVSLCQEM